VPLAGLKQQQQKLWCLWFPTPHVWLTCWCDLQAEDFDDGVVHQLNAKRSEEEAVAAVRHIAHYDLANIQHMAAYLNHLVKHYNHNAAAAAAAASDNGSLTGGAPGAAGGPTAATAAPSARPGASGVAQGGSLGSTLGGSRTSGGSTAAASAGAGGNLGAFGGQIRLASVPVSTKAMLQKLPLKVFRQLEQLVAGCAYLEWRHFDAGVVKVCQLSTLPQRMLGNMCCEQQYQLKHLCSCFCIRIQLFHLSDTNDGL
jgi:hypothetical protein